MARPREFDYDDVLNAAMQAFWARGYEATSVQDLMDATGLQKGSLYKAFGDKHSLFLKALDAYLRRMTEDDLVLLRKDLAPHEALSAFLHQGIDMMSGEDGAQCGCFAINTVVELAPHDPEVQRLLFVDYQRRLDAITDIIVRGQASGAFRADAPPRQLATTFLTSVFGMILLLRGGVPVDDIHATADNLITLLS